MKNARQAPQVHFRAEKAIKDAIRLSAEYNMRSLNDEVVFRLRAAYMAEGWLDKAKELKEKAA